MGSFIFSIRELFVVICRMEFEQSRLDKVEEELEALRDENEPSKESSSGRRSRLAKKRSGLANDSRQLETLEAERATLRELVESLGAQLDELRARTELPSIEQLCVVSPADGEGHEDDEKEAEMGSNSRRRGRATLPYSYSHRAAHRPLYLLSDARREAVTNPLVLRLRSDPALLECDAERIDWLRISAELFEGRLSDVECRLFWTNTLQPRINRELWTDDEQRSLATLVAQHEGRFWSLIADELATGVLLMNWTTLLVHCIH